MEEMQVVYFEDWVRDLRIDNGFSMPQMAKCLDVSASTIYNLENGIYKLTPKIMKKISDRFDIPMQVIRAMPHRKKEDKE